MKVHDSYRLLGLPLSLAILGGCGSNEENKIVKEAPPVTAQEVNSSPVPNVDNPSAPPLAPADGAMPKEAPQPATGDAPAVSDAPAAPTETPKSE